MEHKKTGAYYIFFSLILFGISSCKKDSGIIENVDVPTSSANKIIGVVQKGPFSVGSAISMQELLPSLSPTGRIFQSQVEDNRGSFQLSNIFLVSSYIALRADGFYFNEITGEQSASQITLNCISDIKNKSTINVNLLSHLEKPRIEYLISQGDSFYNAKKQAEQEVLKIFNIAKPTIPESELLDITQNGDDNAVLLAISIILQGNRTEGELSSLLASISYDLRPDGILSDSTLGSALINDANYLKLDLIRQNIKTRWSILGITDTIPDFEKYVIQFIDSTNYSFTNFITYSNSGNYGPNLLNKTDSLYHGQVSISAFLPTGASLIVMTPNTGPFYYYGGYEDGWVVTNISGWNVWTSTKSGNIQAWGGIDNNCSIKIYENGSSVPTRVKKIYVQ